MKKDPLTFLGELKRRRVGRALLLYVATSFAVIEAADIVLEALSQPDWMLQVLLALVALGLPVALVLAWMFDLDVERGRFELSKAEVAEPGRVSTGSGISSSASGRVSPPPAPRWVSPASLVGSMSSHLFARPCFGSPSSLSTARSALARPVLPSKSPRARTWQVPSMSPTCVADLAIATWLFAPAVSGISKFWPAA